MTEATLVTGGSNGIGRAIVQRLAGEGHTVINVDRVAPPSGAPGHFRQIDLVQKDAARVALARLADEFSITRLVNNAGVVRARPVEQVTPEEFEAVVALNLGAAVLCVQTVFPAMRAANVDLQTELKDDHSASAGLTSSPAFPALSASTRPNRGRTPC